MAGKGDKNRVRDHKKYQESPLWKSIDKVKHDRLRTTKASPKRKNREV